MTSNDTNFFLFSVALERFKTCKYCHSSWYCTHSEVADASFWISGKWYHTFFSLQNSITFFAFLYARLLGDPTQTSLLFSLRAARFINVTPGTYKYSIASYLVVLLPYGNCCFVVRLGKRSEAIHGWLWRNNEYEQRQSKWKGLISFFLTSAKFAARKQFYRFSHAVQWVAKVSARFTLSSSSPPLSGRVVSVNLIFWTFRYSYTSY